MEVEKLALQATSARLPQMVAQGRTLPLADRAFEALQQRGSEQESSFRVLDFTFLVAPMLWKLVGCEVLPHWCDNTKLQTKMQLP
jgi:hypothetical protein